MILAVKHKVRTILLLVMLLVLLFLLIGCQRSNQPAPNTAPVDHLVLGDSISTIAQQMLMKELTAVLATSNSAAAVSFCSERAYPITDSIAAHYKCTIQRVAKKNRNSANRLSGIDNKVFADFAFSLQQGQKPTPQLIDSGEMVMYYKPILLGMPMCLQCHGETNMIDPHTKKVLAEKYPHDKAINFRQGDLRGMWKITFAPKHN